MSDHHPFDLSGTVASTVPLPFSLFQDAPEMRGAGLTVGDLHDGATTCTGPRLRTWRMGDPAVPCTTLSEIQDWIERRRQEAEWEPWVRMIVNASDEDELIARICA